MSCMSKIKVLDKHLAELIAAGEVVERPASAVKEMLENSIDSGANKVTVKISCGGVKMIQVTDNGSGIEREDVKKAFLKNATSKLKTEEDLFKISTLGFRGEALASICAVSKVEMVTKTKGEKYGTHYKIVGGEEILFEEGSCPVGTTIIVKDLFFNVPARMKFLSSNSYEGNLVFKVVEKVALSHPEVSFKFFRDKKEELNTLGDNNIESAIYSIYGKNFLESLVPVNYKEGDLKIFGYITKPECSSASRHSQLFFINKRYVKSNIIKTALEESYKGFSMVGKFPSCVLYLDLPFDFLDVNVHPAKTEVKFNNDKSIYNLVYYAAKNALNSLNFNFISSKNNYNHHSNDFSYLRGNNLQKKDKDLINFEKNILEKYVKKSPDSKTPSEKAFNTEDIKVDFFKDLGGSNNLTAAEKKAPASDFGIVPKVYVPKVEEKSLGDNSDREEEILSFIREVKKNETMRMTGAFLLDRNIMKEVEKDLLENNKKNRITEKLITNDILNKGAKKEEKEELNTEKPKFYENTKQQILPEFKEKKALLLENDNSNSEVEDDKTLREEIDKKLIGEAFKTYIILQMSKDKIMFIDKHAAHERLIYEKLTKEKHKDSNQMLLESITLNLNKDEYDVTLKNKEVFLDLGFLVEDFGKNMVIVRSAPLWIEKKDIKNTVMDLISDLLDNKKKIDSEKLDWIYKNMACRAAIKANDVSKREELIALVLDIKKNNIKYCPHGRPVYFILNKLDLEKRFFRK